MAVQTPIPSLVAPPSGAPASVWHELRKLPNLLTATRLVLLVVLWGFALTGHAVVVGAGLGLAFLTDVLDGYAARRLNSVSAFGSRFDSAVDSIVGPSAIAWLLMLRPEVVTDHLALVSVWLMTTYASLALGLVRHRRLANLHLQSSRVACVVQYAFLVDVFVSSSYSPLLLYLAAGLGIYSSLETFVVQAVFDSVDEHEVSFHHALTRRRPT